MSVSRSIVFSLCFFSPSPFLSDSVQEMKICSAIINLFHLIPAAPQTLVKPLLEVVMKTERAMLIEVKRPPPVRRANKEGSLHDQQGNHLIKAKL